MAERTITLRSDLVERLERLAQGRTLDDVMEDLLPPASSGNWALALAEDMEAADIDWQDDPDASLNSREQFERHLRERTQAED